MYLWNTFKILGKHFSLGDNVLKLIDKALNDMDIKPNVSKYDADNRALLLLLKGACLRQMKSPMQSMKYGVAFFKLKFRLQCLMWDIFYRCLEAVINLNKDIKEDLYIVPYAIVEIGLLYADQGRKENAIAALEDAK